ncbi:ribulose-phosphate 3-epimerase [Scatolibacter rhodanostii]|uniref:ribulose-phosphate 3-epimerase n=1 Tax=Scatolibacter rhodanostii TaxID=2014781 RepID=UPI000C08519A|nr:ribulose-phosphate 3-epimerase [Scatolibacter rhodanostii]
MLIAPSILAADFSALGEEIKKTKGADLLHIDIMDGCFVPNISIGPDVVAALRDKTDLIFDVHLMIIKPLRYIEKFVKAGADQITFHVECEDDTNAVIDEIHRFGIKAGLAIKPSTPVSVLAPFAEKLHTVIVMSVEPGFGGQSLIPETLTKIKEIKQQFPHILVEVDGGVNRDTIKLCHESGADILISGTGVFRAEDPQKEIEFLRSGK